MLHLIEQRMKADAFNRYMLESGIAGLGRATMERYGLPLGNGAEPV